MYMHFCIYAYAYIYSSSLLLSMLNVLPPTSNQIKKNREQKSCSYKLSIKVSLIFPSTILL